LAAPAVQQIGQALHYQLEQICMLVNIFKVGKEDKHIYKEDERFTMWQLKARTQHWRLQRQDSGFEFPGKERTGN